MQQDQTTNHWESEEDRLWPEWD